MDIEIKISDAEQYKKIKDTIFRHTGTTVSEIIIN